jgi:alpha-galactosidase
MCAAGSNLLLKKAGYVYLNIDDCWAQRSRDNITGELVPDQKKFPGQSFQEMISSIHNKSMKVGIYSDSGKLTCAKQAGSWGFVPKDAETFARWKVDCRHCRLTLPALALTIPDLKYDDCNVPADEQDECAHCEYPYYDCPKKYGHKRVR